MAENIGFTKLALWYHYRELKANKRPCPNHADCMDSIIKEIEHDNQQSAAKEINNPPD